MAFGQSMKAQSTKTDDGEKQVYESQWMPKVSGTRTFRLLCALDEDKNVILTPRLSSTGKPLTAGNKKNGEVLMGPEPAEEVGFLSAWWTVMVEGSPQPRRIIMDINVRWSNPLWKHIEKNFAKGTPERSAIKTLCALNVYDMTPVIRYEGNVYYPDDNGEYTVQATLGNGKLVKPVDGDPETLNAIRILEISTGEEGGKHTFQQLKNLVDSVEDTDGLIRRLPEFDLKLRTQGKDIKTTYSIRNTANFKPLPDSVQQLPRYDLKTWLKPWPNEAIIKLIDGEDFNEVVEEYGIQQFPMLEGALAEESNEFD